ncbi:MAG: exopolyphosphatase [Gammaproteobacteria bacterium]
MVAEAVEGRLRIVDKLREMVRLAGGLNENNRLTEEVMQSAVACLERFGQRLIGIPAHGVRAVGTNTLRKAKNSGEFVRRAEAALGHKLDIITGFEEARLIYLGVSHCLEGDGVARRLVIDIGGGSTELILGRQFEPERMESLHIGCVGISTRFFQDGALNESRMRAAEIAALQEFEGIQESFKGRGWDLAIGASGTILAVREIVLAQAWSEDGIRASAMRRLRKALIAAGDLTKLELPSLQKERVPVFPGGFAILWAAFQALGIERIQVSDGALREGLLYDLQGRIHEQDVREHTVSDLLSRYEINRAQAERVAATALYLYEIVADDWKIREQAHALCLRWSGFLHQLGMSISHSQHHKHGAYLLENLDMPGFSKGEQQFLATLVRAHRRKFPVDEIKEIPKQSAEAMRRLCIILRLSALLHRSQNPKPLPLITAKVDESKIWLVFPPGWLDEHPLTRADLEQEAAYLEVAGYALKFS